MFCGNCGKELPEGALFCDACGVKIQILGSDCNLVSGTRKSEETRTQDSGDEAAKNFGQVDVQPHEEDFDTYFSERKIYKEYEEKSADKGIPLDKKQELIQQAQNEGFTSEIVLKKLREDTKKIKAQVAMQERVKSLLEMLTTPEFEAGLKELEGLAQNGEVLAQKAMGLVYSGVYEDKIPVNFNKAIEWYTRGANQGDAEAQCSLGALYELARDNMSEAIKWYQAAAEQGFPMAEYRLGEVYHKGPGSVCDHKKAAYWYSKAVAHIEPEQVPSIQYKIATCYDRASAEESDYEQAMVWYRKAAENGHAVAYRDLAYMYKMGRGCKKDVKIAAQLYQKAAELGDAVAQHSIGRMYELGEGVSKDLTSACQWYQKAVAQKDIIAHRYLGIMYEEGRGVPRDRAKAIKLLAVAAKKDSRAKEFLQRIKESKMDSSGQQDRLAALSKEIKASGINDIDSYYKKTETAYEEAKKIYDKKREEFPEDKEDLTWKDMLAGVVCVAIALAVSLWFEIEWLFWISALLLVAAGSAAIDKLRGKKPQCPPELKAAEQKLLDATKEYEKAKRLRAISQEYQQLSNEINCMDGPIVTEASVFGEVDAGIKNIINVLEEANNKKA